jgi:hypothetical protein
MNPALKSIPDRVISLALGALAQANTHATFHDPGNEHWEAMGVLNAAHAGELVLKAAIAKEHPLLIFRDIFAFDDGRLDQIEYETLIQRGKTHDFDKLPQIYWAVTGNRIQNPACYEKIRRARNAIQHFCMPGVSDLRHLSSEFIYTVVDPILYSCFGLYAIEFHEDHNIGYDYIVSNLIRKKLRFSMPPDFTISEVDLSEDLANAGKSYAKWFRSELKSKGISNAF